MLKYDLKKNVIDFLQKGPSFAVSSLIFESKKVPYLLYNALFVSKTAFQGVRYLGTRL